MSEIAALAESWALNISYTRKITFILRIELRYNSIIELMIWQIRPISKILQYARKRKFDALYVEKKGE